MTPFDRLKAMASNPPHDLDDEPEQVGRVVITVSGDQLVITTNMGNDELAGVLGDILSQL